MEKILEKLIRKLYKKQPRSGTAKLLFKYFGVSVMNEIFVKYYWDVQSGRWHFHGPPIRPSSEDLEIYSFFLDKKKHAQNILVLGVTPELRNLLAKKLPGRKITVADFSPEMHRATIGGLKLTGPSSEEWINSNWLSLPVPEQSFDIIIGDRVLEQFFSQKDERSFFGEIKRLLRPTGVFISRFRLRNDKLRDISAKKIIEDVLRENQQPAKGVSLALVWRIRDAYTSRTGRTMDCASIKRVLEEYVQEKEPVSKFAVAFERVLRDMTAFPFRWNHASPSRDELEALYFTFFMIAGERCSSDYFDAGQHPIFIFTPRKNK